MRAVHPNLLQPCLGEATLQHFCALLHPPRLEAAGGRLVPLRDHLLLQGQETGLEFHGLDGPILSAAPSAPHPGQLGLEAEDVLLMPAAELRKTGLRRDTRCGLLRLPPSVDLRFLAALL